jgi:hypothetical protein
MRAPRNGALVACVMVVLSGCTTTRFEHRCANGDIVSVVAEGSLYTRDLGGFEIHDSCGGASLSQVKTDAVQAFEAGVKAAAGLVGAAK